MPSRTPATDAQIGVGFYTIPEAARLLRLPVLNIRRWLAGYNYKIREGIQREMPPLWLPQLPSHGRHIELGFRDLIEIRFISAFVSAGLSVAMIRRCLQQAQELVGDERPFSTRRFRTDGRTIFLEIIDRAIEQDRDELLKDGPGGFGLIDLKNRQYVFRDVIAPTFKDLDFDDEAVVRWRPFNGKETIVIDPTRAFGQPIASTSGVPTRTLADAVAAEGNERRVAALFEVTRSVVRDAIVYERELEAA